MNSPRGTNSIPARLDRDGSISPQLLDPISERNFTQSSHTRLVISDEDQKPQLSAAPSRFLKLRSSIISRILWSVDANTFASLCILNRQWRTEAQKVELYAHHLSRCPSHALSNNIISGPFRRNDLSRLKAKFAAEVRRNLFEAYLRPQRTFINLISINANSSAAFPAGEAFRFEFSPNGRTILALSSSRIYIIDLTTDLPVVTRRLKTLRRPLSASITDDGSLLAVLSSKHQVNIYALTPQGVQHLQVIVLDNPPKIIAITHEGTVLAASFETGIEVFSLAANCLTTDRRAVRSEAVDALSFSGDGSMLVGSSLSLDDPNAVIISAPFYTENDPELSHREMHSRMWTTQILFPQISSVCSHVTLLPGHIEGDAYWLFAYDHSLMSYRAVRTDDTRAGVAYFLSPPGADRFDTPIPTLSPSATACGSLAVAGFEGGGLCLYGIPERLDVSPDMGAVIERQNDRQMLNGLPLTSATGITEPLMAYSPSTSASDCFIEDDSLASKVDWRQSLFVKCTGLHGIPGQTAARWVEHPDNSSVQSSKRLAVVAPGGVNLDAEEFGEEGMPTDGSRMCLLDFNYTPTMLPDRTLTIEVGEEEPEILTEHTGSLAAEVAMERRRTIRAIPTFESTRIPLGRSVTSVSPPSEGLFEGGFRRNSVSTPSSPIEPSRGSQIQSASSLHRSATAAGFRHARYPPRPPLGSVQHMNENYLAYPGGGQGRPTSEDSWETPPPPYAGAGRMANLGGQLTRDQTLLRMQAAHDGAVVPLGQSQYRPYRSIVAERRSATLDAIMSSQALPSGPVMSQQEELMMAARSRGLSESSLSSFPRGSLNRSESSDFVTGSNVSPLSPELTSNGYRRARPLTHHGAIPSSWQTPSRSVSMPITPSTPEEPEPFVHGHLAYAPTEPAVANGVSLTGANLQNRLNHPVPPIPQTPMSLSPGTPNAGLDFRSHDPSFFQPVGVSNLYQPAPTSDQMAGVYRHMSLDEAHRPPAVKNTNFVHRAPGNVLTMPPPRSTWLPLGVSGSAPFDQARDAPDGLLRPRSDSRGSQTSDSASASAPDLLAQRPRYGRLDTIDSVNDGVRYGGVDLAVRARAHSMIQPIVAPPIEPSAYHETSRSGPNTTGKPVKKSKKKRDETTKKGIRCVVM